MEYVITVSITFLILLCLAEPSGVGWSGMSVVTRECSCYNSHSGEDGITTQQPSVLQVS